MKVTGSVIISTECQRHKVNKLLCLPSLREVYNLLGLQEDTVAND